MQKLRLSSQRWASDHRKKSQNPFNTGRSQSSKGVPSEEWGIKIRQYYNQKVCQFWIMPKASILTNKQIRSMWVGTYLRHPHLLVPVEASTKSQVVIPSPYQQASTNQSKLQRSEGYVSMQSRPKSQKMLTYFESEDSHLPLSCLSCGIIPSCPSHPSPGTFWLT